MVIEKMPGSTCHFSTAICSSYLNQMCTQGQRQVVKGDANSGIYMDDTKQDVDRKIKKAFCPLHDQGFRVHENPVLTYITSLVLPWTGKFIVTFTKEDDRQKCVPDLSCRSLLILWGSLLRTHYLPVSIPCNSTHSTSCSVSTTAQTGGEGDSLGKILLHAALQ